MGAVQLFDCHHLQLHFFTLLLLYSNVTGNEFDQKQKYVKRYQIDK
jgi:hypothetical protein